MNVNPQTKEHPRIKTTRIRVIKRKINKTEESTEKDKETYRSSTYEEIVEEWDKRMTEDEGKDIGYKKQKQSSNDRIHARFENSTVQRIKKKGDRIWRVPAKPEKARALTSRALAEAKMAVPGQRELLQKPKG